MMKSPCAKTFSGKISFALSGALLVFCSAHALAQTVSLTGEDGENGSPGNRGEDGESAIVDIGPLAEPFSQAIAEGGEGGEGGDRIGDGSTGDGGNGGNATASITAPPFDSNFANISATGGDGGNAIFGSAIFDTTKLIGNGGRGGDANGQSSIAVDGDNAGGTTWVLLEAGHGGMGLTGGDGGSVDASSAVSTTSAEHGVSVLMGIVGGSGGQGREFGGQGADAIFDQALDVSGPGRVSARLNATGGQGGGAIYGNAGHGGDAVVEQTMEVATPVSIPGDSIGGQILGAVAIGGNGGAGRGGSIAQNAERSGDGGDARIRLELIENPVISGLDSTGRLDVSAVATAGAAGSAKEAGRFGKAGDASAVAIAHGVEVDRVAVSSTAAAGLTNRYVLDDGTFIAGEAGSAFAQAIGSTQNREGLVEASAHAVNNGGGASKAIADITANRFAFGVSARSSEGLIDNSAIVETIGFQGDGSFRPTNDNQLSLTAAAQAGPDVSGRVDEDFFALGTVTPGLAGFGEEGSIVRQLAEDSDTNGLSAIAFYASADAALTESIFYQAEYSLLPLTPEFSFVEGDVFKLGVGDIVTEGDGFDSLSFELALNGISLIDEIFETIDQFTSFFEDDIFQYVFGEDDINGMTGFTNAQAISVNLQYRASPTDITSMASLFSNAITAGTELSTKAFGFNLFVAEGASLFTATPGGGDPGDGTPSEVPVPAAFWFMLSGLLIMYRKRKGKAALAA